MNPIEIVKRHPTISIVAIVVVVGVVLLMTSGGGGENPGYIDATYSDQSGAIALAQYQAQQQGETLAITAQKDVELARVASERFLGELAAQTRSAEIAASLDLGRLTTERQAESTNLANTLAAKIAGDQFAMQKAQSDAQFATIQAQIASQTALNTKLIETQAATAQQSIAANVQVAKINKPKRSLFSKIFG